jgi:hypothetical protein
VTVWGADNTTIVMTLSDAIVDAAGNKFAGATYTYSIGDHVAPTATVTPTGDQGDDTTFDLVMTFDENVVKGAGTIKVYRGSTVFVEYDVDDANVMLSGNTVTIPVSLDKESAYWVSVSNGFVLDMTGNAFAGISDPADWAFETQGFATPVIDIENIQFKVYPNPFNDHINIDNGDKLSRVVISNIAGQRVIDVEYPGRVVRTPNLVSGVYVVTLFTENGITKTERIVKR